MNKEYTSTFEDLSVWQKCRELRNKVSKLAKSFPKDEQFRLVDQMMRASRSPTANIAEVFNLFVYLTNLTYVTHLTYLTNVTIET